MAGRYKNPIPTWFLAPIDWSKIPAQATQAGGIDSLESIPWFPKSLKIPCLAAARDERGRGWGRSGKGVGVGDSSKI